MHGAAGNRSDGRTVIVVAYDPRWPAAFAELADELRGCLGDRARDVIHVGSTAVPGLVAKPVVDVVVVARDAADEPAYLGILLDRGFHLAVREPDWFEHRMLQRSDPFVNLHVFSVGCEEVDRELRFRDWLRTHDDDRDLYAAAKLELASRHWQRGQDYADAKSGVITAIMARAQGSF